MRLVVVGNLKGGVGKTTVAVGLGAAIAAAGSDVVVIDGDLQDTGSAASWINNAARGDTPVGPEIDVAVKDIAKRVARWGDADCVIVDCPNDLAYVTQAAETVASAGGVFLVPTTTGLAPAQRAFRTCAVAADTGATVAVVLNRVRSEPQSRDLRAAMTDAGITVLETEIPLRAAIEARTDRHFTPHSRAVFDALATELAART